MNASKCSVLCCLLLVAGCSKSDKAAPAGGTADSNTLVIPAADGPAVVVELEEDEPTPSAKPSGRLYSDLSKLPAYDGGKLLAAGQFEPHGATFQSGARLKFPLPSALDPSRRLSLVVWDSKSGEWRWLGQHVSISPDGLTAVAEAPHFSTLGIAEGSPSQARDSLTVRALCWSTKTKPLAGVKVEILFATVDETLKEAMTDAKGEAYFPQVPGSSGKFRVRLSGTGLITQIVPFEKSLGTPAEVAAEVPVSPDQASLLVKFHFYSKKKGKLSIAFSEYPNDLSAAAIDDVFKKEAPYYQPQAPGAYQWDLVPNGTVIQAQSSKLPGYILADNRATRRQLCGGLALSPLFGGPYLMPTDKAWEIVSFYGKKVFKISDHPGGRSYLPPEAADIKPGDIVVFSNSSGVTHFALVEHTVVDGKRQVRIFSKDQQGPVWLGLLEKWPRTGYGDYDIYRLPWDEIDVWREGDPEPSKERVTPKHCKDPVSQLLPIAFANAMVTASDEVSRMFGVGVSYRWGGEALRVQLQNDLAKISELKGKLTISGVLWLDEKAGRKSWWLNVLSFETEELPELTMSKDVRWYGDSKLTELQPRDVGGVKGYRPRPPAPVDASNVSPLDQALATNKLASTAFIMWRSGRYIFLLERYLLSSTDQELAVERDREQLIAEDILGIVNRCMTEGGVTGPRRPVGFPGRR